MADSSRQAELLLLIKETGAKETAAEIQKLATTTASVQQELVKISRADQIQRIGTEMGLLAKKTKDVAAAAKELSKNLQAIGASKDEIASATGAFSAAQQGGGVNRLARAGSEIRALPSTQIPGLGIGTDAIGNFLRLGGAISGLSEKTAEATKLGIALTPVLGQTAAGLATMGIAAGVIALPIIAVALALKGLGDQAAVEAKAINAIVESQRKVGQDIARGLTTDEANTQIEDLNRLRDDEIERVAKLKQNYQDNVNSAGALSPVLKILSGAEEELNSQIAKGTGDITTYETQIAALTLAQQDGSLAANDAAEAEKKLAEERSKAALTSADNAGKELQSQQKALSATEEQNKQRLKSIENEKAVAQRQIDVLEASGVTSEEVTKKIAALKEQLGLLGKESAFISETALEASRAADAEKKAIKDKEDADRKAAQAQDQYTKAVDSASTTFKNSVQDIGTRLSQTLQDNTLKLNRDLATLGTKFAQDQEDLQIKSNRAELEAYQDQIKDLNKIRDDAAKDEREALIEGDFKALYLARLARDEALQVEQQADLEEQQKRKQNQDYALEDLKRASDRQRDARRLGYEQQNTDAQTARDRDIQQARTAQTRALAQASSALQAELGLRQQFWNATLKQAQAAIGQMNGAKPSGANTRSPFGQFTGSFKAVISR